MCGLVALINKRPNGFTREQQDVFASLLFIDMLRGQDSTGVMTINNNGDVFVAKDAKNSVDFMQTNEFEEAMKRAWNRGAAMIGHNRKATKGSITDENAHPFNVDDNIILVHNGTMRSDHKKHADVEVDSHAIAHLIHQKKGNVTEALSAFTGAYALIWYEIENATIHIIRNDERPLFWIETDNAWILSSEAEMLNFVIQRHNLKAKDEPQSLPEFLHQKFELVQNGGGWKVSDQKLTIKSPITSYGQYGDACGWEPAWGTYGHASNNNKHEHSNIYEDDARYEEYLRRNRPFRPAAAAQLLPRPHAANVDSSKSLANGEPVEFAGQRNADLELGRKLNKLVPYGEYHKKLILDYAHNTQVMVCPFDYRYVNGRDNSDGYYLYACPVDDERIVLRHYYSNRYCTEERMVQLASTDHVFEFTIGVKWWIPSDAGPEQASYRDDCRGVFVIKSTGARMISRGIESLMKH